MIHKGETRDTVDLKISCVLDWSALEWCVLNIFPAVYMKLQENRKFPLKRFSLLGQELEDVFQTMSIGDISWHHGTKISKDNAHGLFGKYRARWPGASATLGWIVLTRQKSSLAAKAVRC